MLGLFLLIFRPDVGFASKTNSLMENRKEENTMRGKLISADTKKTASNIAKGLKGVIIPIAGVVLSSITISDLLNAVRYSGNVGYDDAVKVIMNSNMMASYKTEAISVLKHEGIPDYYRAVISTVNSDMMSSYKVDAIRNMSKEE